MLFYFINKITDTIVSPFNGLSAITGLVVVSFVSSVLLLYIFKILSNQEKIKYHKDKIFGHFLEIAIYRDQFRRTMLCQTGILKHNLLYLRYFLFPLLIIMPPVIIVCMQLDFRLGSTPFQENQSFIIQATLDKQKNNNLDEALNKIHITTTDNITLETDELQSPTESSVFWRANIVDPTGTHVIRIKMDGTDEEVIKDIAVVGASGRFSPDKRKIETFSDNLFSGEVSIPQNSPFQLVRVSYPSAAYPFIVWNFSPIVYYFILTLVFGFMLKPFIKVNI